jgi:hypothetical protein
MGWTQLPKCRQLIAREEEMVTDMRRSDQGTVGQRRGGAYNATADSLNLQCTRDDGQSG